MLFVNYFPRGLARELSRRGYTVASLNSSSILRHEELLGDYDAVYFAKFTPPLMDDAPLFYTRGWRIVYGLHAPFLIYYPYRPSNYFYNAASIAKALALLPKRDRLLYHALNPVDRDALVALGHRAHYCPVGVDTEEYRPLDKTGEFTVVFVSPRYQKGADLLPYIVPVVAEKIPETRFVFTGRGFLHYVYSLLEKRYPGRVEVVVDAPRERYVEIMGRSHVLLFLSRYEGFSHTLLEALASGMGVVAFNIPGGPREALLRHGTGYVVKPFDIAGIVRGVVHYYRAYRRGVFEEEVVARARRVAKLFDWRVLVKCYTRIFESLIKEA